MVRYITSEATKSEVRNRIKGGCPSISMSKVRWEHERV